MAGDAGWGQLSPAGELLTKDLGPTELTSGLTCNYGKHFFVICSPTFAAHARQKISLLVTVNNSFF